MSTPSMISQYCALRRENVLHCDCDMKLTLDGRQKGSKPRFHLAYACNHKIALVDIALFLGVVLLAVIFSCCRFHIRFRRRH